MNSKVSGIDFNELPIIKSFESLKVWGLVYSSNYGVGTILQFYGDEVIVSFKNFRKRFSVDDQELRLIPPYLLEKRKIKITITVEGEQMSYSAYKRKFQLTKRKIKEKKEECVTLKEASEILGVMSDELLRIIKENGLELEDFGKRKMLHRSKLLLLSKIL